MARIFLSHSSANNAEAMALRDWLLSQGFDDLFLDLDPDRGLKAGQKWQAELKRAAERCELVIFLVSPAWRASEWCVAEFLLAKNMNKRIVGVIVDPMPLQELPVEMTGEWQLVDLTAGKRNHKAIVTPPPGDKKVSVAFAEDGLERLRIGLMQAGIDARYFVWPPESDPERAPYRGLQPLEAEDAGIFFGRDGPTVVGLDLLRGLREASPPRLLVILGASGAGKSSFLRAGLLPRLARESQHFLPAPGIRPERAVLSGEAGLIACLEKALKEAGLPRSRAEIRKAVEQGPESAGALLEKLVAAKASGDGSKKPPTLVLPIDQAEELFLAEGAEEARAFLGLLSDLLTRDSPALIALFTIRSDSYERLQTAEALQGLRQHALSLPPMPRGAYAEVIKGPARRLDGTKRALKIEDSLVDALLSDIEQGGAKDALPLLAFTLERLYVEQGGDGDLRLSEYQELGGVKGSIEAAVERALKAADDDPKIPRDREARLALLRRALIPWLAGIDPETGSPRRRIARLSEIPTESRPLIDLLIEQRLLSTDVSKETGEVTIEPAHEALLRQWGLLQGWLEEDFAALTALDAVHRASRDWEANVRDQAWLAHGGGRLDDAEALLGRVDLAASLDSTDRAYLAACRAAEAARRNRELEEARKLATAERKAASRTRIGLVVASVLALLAIGALGWALVAAKNAGERAIEAVRNETVGLAALSATARGEGRPISAIKLALAAWPREGDDGRPQLRLTLKSLGAAIWNVANGVEIVRLEGHDYSVIFAAFSPDGTKVVTGSKDDTARVWDARTGAVLAVLDNEYWVGSATFSPDGTRILTATEGDRAGEWDATTGAQIAVFELTSSENGSARLWDRHRFLTGLASGDVLRKAVFSPDGSRAVTLGEITRLWDLETNRPIMDLKGDTFASFSSDSTGIVTASSDEDATVWNAATGAPLVVLRGHTGGVLSAVFSPDGTRIVTTSGDKTSRVWNAATGAEIFVLDELGEDKYLTSAVFSPDGTRIVTASMDNSIRTPTQDNSARLWDSTTGAEVGRLKIGDSVNSAEFSPDGTLIVVASSDHTARIWDISRLIGDKGAFALACAMLGNDTDLFDIRAHYGLGEIAPICGDHKPLPVDWPKIE